MIEPSPSVPRAPLGWLAVALLALAFVGGVALLLPYGFVGFYRDDTTYALGARALLAGKGYVDLSLPEHPGVQRFPPGFSLLLALAMAGGHGLYDQLVRAQWVPAVFGVATILLSFRYIRLNLEPRTVPAVAATTWVATQPAMLMMGARVMSDVPFTAMGLAAVLAFDAALAGTAGLASWVGVGVLMGCAVLVRYAGVALVGACAIVLARARRWREGAAVAAGLVALLAPWWIYRAMVGGGDYAKAVSAMAPHDAAGMLQAATLIAGGFFGNAAPGMLFGGVFHSFGPLVLTGGKLLVGLAITSVILVGALVGFLRPAPGRSGLGEAYLLLTLTLVAVWTVPFAWYGDNLMQRLLLPVVPFGVVAALRGVETAWTAARLPGPQAARAAATTVGVASNMHGCLLALLLFWIPPSNIRVYEGLFDAIRRQTPPDARLMSQDGHLTTLYTDRLCSTIPVIPAAPGEAPRAPSPRTLVLFMARDQVQYLVGTPDVQWGSTKDRTVELVNAVILNAPGLLTELYKSPYGTFALWRVDQTKLKALDTMIRHGS